MKTVNPSTSLRVNGERSQTIKFFTLGCKVNQYETQAMREQFIRRGFKEIANGKPSDVYLINTCTVTHRADAESLRLIYKAKRENPQASIIVTGCLTELDSDKIAKFNGVARIVKNQDKYRIIELLEGNNKLKERNEAGISSFWGHTRAFLKIQDGCDNFCSYCKVPLVRGKSRSRPKELIIEEAKRLVNNGFKEIVLCGICLGTYGKDLNPKINLADIIGELEKIEGLLRIRLSSIEAGDVSDGLINRIAQNKKLCRHLHIPIQSGDDEILKKMNRKYSPEDYSNLIRKIKSRIPGIAITTDALVGFPGESDSHFQNTVKLIKEIQPLEVHIFPYSPREGTQAKAKYEQDLDPKIIKERFLYLKKIAEACSLRYKKQFLNKGMKVLVEGRSKYKAGFWEGHTDNYLKVLLKSDHNLKNEFITVKLKKLVQDYVLA